MAQKKKVEAVDAVEETEAGTDRLERAREKFSEVAQRARQGGEQVRDTARKGGEVAKEKYGVAVDGLKQGYDRVHKDMDKLTDDVNEYVRDNPGRSVLMAAGLGFVVGMLLRGRRS